ncbi:MAG: glycosyltransferase family 39 protein [Treponema sp.]|nr:glycosyltransferase family 39 protein [Treponema sp.]
MKRTVNFMYKVIFFVITLCYALKYVTKYHKNKLAVLAVSILFVMNPVVLAQLFTYYVYELMGMLIIILFFACSDYEQENDIKDIIVIIAVSVFAINTKTTGFICGVVLIGYIIRLFSLKKHTQMSAHKFSCVPAC